MLNVSKRTAYVILAISIIIEIIGDAMLTASHGYDHLLLGIGAVITILFSFFLFSKVLHIIDLPIAYATWSVVGALVCTLLGVFFFHQPLSKIGWISMIVLAAATFTMNMWGTPAEPAPESDVKPDAGLATRAVSGSAPDARQTTNANADAEAGKEESAC